MSWIKKVLGDKGSESRVEPAFEPAKQEEVASEKQPDAVSAPPAPTKSDEGHLAVEPSQNAAAKARRTYWSKFGEVDPQLLTPTFSDHLQSERPSWPSGRESFTIIRRPHSVIIATDGLTDPWPDKPASSGVGAEFYIEAPRADAKEVALQEIARWTELEVLRQLAFNALGWPNITVLFHNHHVLSTAIPAYNNMDSVFIADTPRGRAFGLLLGVGGVDLLNVRDGDSALSLRIAPATMILPQELAYIVQNGADARKELTQRLLQQNFGAMSVADRAPVV